MTAAELQSYINALPRYLSEVIQLTVAGGEINQTLVFDSFVGPGYLSVSGEAAAGNLKLKKGIEISRCAAMIQILECEISGISKQNNPDQCCSIYNSIWVHIAYCDFVGASNTGCPVIASHGSHVIIAQCTISGWYQALVATTNAIINVHDCTCSGNTNGAQVWGGGIVLLSGTTPELMGGASNLLQGGLIVKPDGTPYAPLEWHDLPLPNGWTGSLRYARVLNTVYLQMRVETATKPGIGEFTLGYLPEGYRPLYGIVAVGLDVSSLTVMTITVTSNGEIVLYPYVGSNKADWHGTRGSIAFPVP